MDIWTPDKIKELRLRMKLTQKAFAEHIGVTNVYINYLEKGVKTPSKTLCILFSYIEEKENNQDKENNKHGKDKRNL